MRENRTSGSEGGEAQTNELSLPLSLCQLVTFPMWEEPSVVRSDRPMEAAPTFSMQQSGTRERVTGPAPDKPLRWERPPLEALHWSLRVEQ